MNGGAKFLGYTAILAVAACGGEQGKLTIRSVGAPLSSEAKPVPFRIAEAQAQFARGNVALALESFRRALREDPRSVDAMSGIAASYDRMGRYDLSRKHYEAALAVEPANSRVLAALAASLDQQGKSTEAAAVRGEIRQRLAQASAAAAAVTPPVALAKPVARPVQQSASLREPTKSPLPVAAVIEPPAAKPAIQAVANRAANPPVKAARPVAAARPAIQTVAYPLTTAPAKTAPAVAAAKPAIPVASNPATIAPVKTTPPAAVPKPAVQVASSPATITPVKTAPAVAAAKPVVQVAAKPATIAPVKNAPAAAAAAATSTAPGPSITIKLPPARPAAVEMPVQSVKAKAPVVPVPVPKAAKPAQAVAAVAASPAKPSPADLQPALPLVAKANPGPRLERTSMSEVTLVTRQAQPMWKPQVVQRTAQSATIRFVPLRLAQARLPIRILNAARVNRLAANTRMIIARRGWKNVVIGNAPATRMRSIVLYPAKARPAAQRLAAQLGFASALRPRSREVTVILGRDASALARKRRIA